MFTFNWKSLVLIFILFNKNENIAQQKKFNILASASMWADMAQVIGGTLIDVDMIVPIGSDPHLYEPTPTDISKVKHADLILINGLTFESWLIKLINNSADENKIILLSKNIKAITSAEHQGATDPHAWMDASNGLAYATEIYKALAKLDPLHDREYEFNFNIYKKELESLDQYIKEKFSIIPREKRVLITSHDAFRYFGNRYDIELHALLGISTDADVSSVDFISINKLIKERSIPAIFIESTINPKIMLGIQSENNVAIGGKLFADSLGDENSEASTYIKMLKHNADVISNALLMDKNNNHSKKKNISPSMIYTCLIAFYLFCFAALFFINKK